jgi:hypothetical protein
MFSEQLVMDTWDKLSRRPSIWKELDGSSYEHFRLILRAADILLETKYGLFFVNNLQPKHRANVHGVFWSPKCFRESENMGRYLKLLAKAFELDRIECIIPSELRGLNRLVGSMGFILEGRMVNAFKVRGKASDGNMYGYIPRRETI